TPTRNPQLTCQVAGIGKRAKTTRSPSRDVAISCQIGTLRVTDDGRRTLEGWNSLQIGRSSTTAPHTRGAPGWSDVGWAVSRSTRIRSVAVSVTRTGIETVGRLFMMNPRLRAPGEIGT